MKEDISFKSYEGEEPHIFLRFDKTNKPAAAKIINYLIERHFRISYDECKKKTIADPDCLAGKIHSSQLIVFLISSAALESLEFRNSINYALESKKDVFCIYLDESKLAYGFDMQLANVPGVKLSRYKDIAALCDDIVTGDHFLQVMRGEDAIIPIKNNRKRTAALTAVTAVLAVCLIAAAVIAVDRVNYDNSLAGRIEKITTADYLDISNQKASLIELLKGKTIKELDAKNMGLVDVEALSSVNCEALDISSNPNVATLEPLLNNKGLQVVRVTQDMYPAIKKISGRHTFKIVITG